MAITEKYASSAGAGAKDGSSEANAWDWATMLTSAVAGNRINFKGNHALAANAAFSSNGTVASPIILRGYSTTPGDLAALGGSSYRTNGNGPLITTGFPTIDTGAYKITTPQNSVLETLIVVGQCTSDGVVLTGVRTAVFRCAIANSATSGSHAGINLTGTECVLCDCDIVYSGTVNTCQAVFCGGTVERILSCRIDSAAKGINLAGTSQGVIVGCLIVAVTDGIAGSTAASTIYGNTIVDCGSDGWHGATSNAGLVAFVNNRITDNGAYGLYADPTTSANAYWFLAYNRFDRNVSGATSGASDWVVATSYKQNDTSQPQADEYVNFVTGDYRLKSGAAGKSAGIFSAADIGALQIALPDMPPLEDVEEGTAFGYYGEDTGTFVVPPEEDVESGVGYGEDGEEFIGTLEATYDVGGSATSIEEAIVTKLLSIESLTDLVASRVWYARRAKDNSLPCLVLHSLDVDRDNYLGGVSGYSVAKFNLDCLGETSADAIAVADIVRRNLPAQHATWAGIAIEYAKINSDNDLIFEGGEAESLTVNGRQLDLEIAFQEEIE